MNGQPAPRLKQLAAFKIGEQDYGLDIMKIRAIINWTPIVRVPRLPAFIEGVIELRGEVIPVVDLRRRFELPIPTPTRATKIILVAIAGQAVGLVVDGVSQVVRRAADDIRPAPAFVSGRAGDDQFFEGVLHHDGRTLVILDVAALLSRDEQRALAQSPTS